MQVLLHGSELSAATAAAALAWVGHQVDWLLHENMPWLSLAQVDWLRREPSLMAQLEQALASGQLRVIETLDTSHTPDVVWLALSPSQRDSARQLLSSPLFAGYHGGVLINNSTFPVGETERLHALMGRQHSRVALPDTLEEGRAWAAFTRPMRWLLGCDDAHGEQVTRELLRAFNRRSEVFQRMPCRAAELTKLAINGMLATRISYMNEIAGLADTLGVDVEHVRQGMGADSRIGFEYLYPGCGFGGPNFSRDLMGLADIQSAHGRYSALLEQVMDINEQKKETLFRKLWTFFDGNLAGKTIAVWGAAFKPGTARIDHAPVLTLLEALWAQGVTVKKSQSSFLLILAVSALVLGLTELTSNTATAATLVSSTGRRAVARRSTSGSPGASGSSSTTAGSVPAVTTPRDWGTGASPVRCGRMVSGHCVTSSLGWGCSSVSGWSRKWSTWIPIWPADTRTGSWARTGTARWTLDTNRFSTLPTHRHGSTFIPGSRTW